MIIGTSVQYLQVIEIAHMLYVIRENLKTGVSDPTRRKGGGRGQSGHRGVLTMGAALENELVLRRKDYALCSRT